MKRYSIVLFALFMFAFLVVPEAVIAQSATLEDRGVVSGEPTPAGGIVPAGIDNYSPDGYGSCEFVELVNNVLQFLIGLSALLAVIVFIYAGYLMVSSRGDVGQIQQAKGLFANVAIGFVLMLSAFLIINTILSIMVGSGSGILNWQTIECSYAFESGDPEEYKITLEDYTYNEEGIAIDYKDYSAIGGSCSVRTSGSCSVANLEKYFPGKGDEASQVCNKESGGTPVWSKTDMCADGNSFSGGWFQINIVAHQNRIPGCAGAFTTSPPSKPQGDCLDRRVNGNGVPYCAKWDCRVSDQVKYEQCRKVVEDWDVNISIAQELYKESGSDWTPWKITAKQCGVPY